MKFLDLVDTQMRQVKKNNFAKVATCGKNHSECVEKNHDPQSESFFP
jgi:hypothetical protein